MDSLRRAWAIDWMPAVFALAMMAGATVALLPPGTQDFPLNDDWSYSKGAFAYAQGEGIHYNGWASMPLLGMWWAALPLINVFGESHVALRLVTLCFAAIAAVSLCSLLRAQGVDAGARRLGAGALVFYPVVLVLSGTFMSDVPGLALSLAALALYVRSFKEDWLILGAGAVLVSVIGVLTRQTVFLSGIVALLWLLFSRPELRVRWWMPVAAVLPLVASFAVEAWFGARSDVLHMEPVLPSIGKVAHVLVVGLFTCGLATIPLWLVQRRPKSPLILGLVLTACAGAVAYYLWREANLPFFGNTVTRFGVLFENDLMPGDRIVIVPKAVAIMLVAFGVFGMALLLARAIEGGFALLKGPLVLFSLVNLVLVPFAPVFVDRYLIPLLPGAIALACAGAIQVPRIRIGWAAASAFAVFGWLIYIDWLSWNHARWKLGEEALAKGLNSSDVEGGFEWDGWHSQFDANRTTHPQPRGLTLPFNAHLFPNIAGAYAISFSPLPKTRIVSSRAYRTLLPPSERTMYLVEQTEPGASGARSSEREP